MNRNVRTKREVHMERHVLAAIGTGGIRADVLSRVSNRLTGGERETALTRLEAGGAIKRDSDGRMTRDIQAWAAMRRNRT